MKVFEVIRATIFSMPLGIFITFGLFLAITIQMKVRKVDIIFRRIVASYCFSAAVASLLLLFYYYFHDLFARFDILYSFSVIMAMVLFHHFLCFSIKIDKSFSFFHYVIPLFVCLIMLFCKHFFSVFWNHEGNNVLFVIALFFGVVYSALPFYKMYNYHLKLAIVSNTSETINKGAIIPFLLEIILFPVTFTVIPLITKQNPGIMLSLLQMLFILLALRMNIPLTYAIIRHYGSPMNDMSLFAPDILTNKTGLVINQKTNVVEEETSSDKNNAGGPSKRIYRKYTRKNRSNGQLIEIDKNVFEAYFRKQKPFLNPELKIHDLATPLQSNRTYISKFINRTYGMNFNSYINLCRLHEMERLLELPDNKEKKPVALINQTGFGNYRNYLRAKKQFSFEKSKT